MVETFQEAQLPLLACALISACVAKIAIREPSDTIGPGPLTTLRRHRPAVVTVAIVEGCLGVALLVTAHPVARLGTIVVFFVATSVVFLLRGSKADEGCGCFGGLSTTPVRFRTVLRACLFLLAALAVLAETFATLHASQQWRTYSPLIVTADPADMWRELCWRFLVYRGQENGEDVEIVFAVSTDERDGTVKAAIVRPDDDDSDTGPNHMYALSV